MSQALLISELADRTGFTPSTLRYYEQVGLLAATARGANGYRLYDESVITRLRFIERAKQLGLPLEEIRELVGVWDEGQCAHVRVQLRERIAGRSVEVRSRIVELTTFAAQLDTAGHELQGLAPDGPCGEGCGCSGADNSTAVTPVAVELGPTHHRRHTGVGAVAPEPLIVAPHGDVAVTCSLGAEDQRARLSEWREVLAVARSTQEIEGGVRLQFAADAALAGRLASLAAREQDCCTFFGFALRIEPAWLILEVTAPEPARGLVTDLFGEQR